MGRGKGGKKWRVARWNKLLTDCMRNIFGEPFMIGVCVFVCGSVPVLTVLSCDLVNQTVALQL